ncbi:PPOX class F420-dependent oxidoreductase [Amycolatopsis taiwanensis]|nr:PPOX class F420-dependent oxidoreductase [Amycolatopsis taiwanensis]
MVFTEKEIEYLRQQSLGRLATVGPDNEPQVRPTGYVLNDDGTIDLAGPNLSGSRKWRNIQANPAVAFVVDDMTPDEPGAVKPGWGRGVEVRGHAELLTDHEPPYGDTGFFSREAIRIHPRRILSWHLEAGRLQFTRSVVQASA